MPDEGYAWAVKAQKRKKVFLTSALGKTLTRDAAGTRFWQRRQACE